MNLAILHDWRRQPNLFSWNGAIAEEVLTEWLHARGLRLPNELRALLSKTGGGDFFESETVLGPFGNPALADDLEGVNDFHRSRGMPSRFLLFHTGVFWTAVDLTRGTHVELDPETYSRVRTFESLDQWYQAIRRELGPRYGLTDPA